MAVVNKIKQITEVKIPTLVLMAKADNCDTDVKIAKWVIGHSEYWRSMGYHKIIEEMNK